MHGRQIKLFLVDGLPTGILTAEIMNWSGKIVVAPRTQLADLAKREEPKRTGLYCLVGADPQQPLQDRVYIGEGDNVLKRLLAHEKDEEKDFWTRTIVVISKDENITKAHGRYLESRLIGMAINAGRASVANGTSPECPPLPEGDIADMENFLEMVQMIFPVLGMSFLQPKPIIQVTQVVSNPSVRFVMKEGEKQAIATEIGGEFVVLAGSPARKQHFPSWTNYLALREELVETGKLKDAGDSEHFLFAENVPFSSPSAAASVVAAGNRNGRTYWKVEGTGQTYADWHDSQLPEMDTSAAED